MLKKAFFIVLALLAIFTLAFLLFKNVRKPDDNIVIGHIGPLTGDAAIFGNWEKEGIDLAVDQINASGGVAGHNLSVIHEDDKAEASVSVTAAQSLIARGVHVIISTLSSPTLAIAPVAKKNDIVLFTPSAQSPKISSAGVYRIFASSVVEGAHLANLINKSGVMNISILYLNTDYGVGLQKVILEDLKDSITILASEAYSSDSRDYKTQIQKAIAMPKPEAILLLGFPTDMGIILKQMAEMNIKGRVFAPNGFEGEEIVKIAGKAAEGVVYVYPVLSDEIYTENARNAFRTRYGRDMNVYNGMAYDTIQILVFAMKNSLKQTGMLYGQHLKESLNAIKEFPGVTGPITFDRNGDIVDRPMEARVVRDGKFVRLGD